MKFFDVRKLAAWSCVVALAMPMGWAQQSGDSTPTFRTGTELVLVPVTVTNKSGQHLSGLKKDDFVLTEDGGPQSLAIFEEVRPVKTPARRVQAGAPGEFTNVKVEADSPRRLTIVALDGMNVPTIDQLRARQAMVKYLTSAFTEDSLVSVITITRKGLQIVHDFSSDTASLAAALKVLKSELGDKDSPALPATPEHQQLKSTELTEAGTGGRVPNAAQSDLIYGGNTAPGQTADRTAADLLSFVRDPDGKPNYDAYRDAANTLQSFQHLAQVYAGFPGKKTLLWVTAAFPVQILSPSDMLSSKMGPLYERTFDMLNRASIAVYPVDVRGLYGGAIGNIEACTSCGGLSFARTANDYTPGAAGIGGKNQEIATMETIADMTGGRAFYNSNDLDKSMAAASQDSESYYMVGYYRNTQVKQKPGWRKLQVKVSAPDAKVRSRSGYFVGKQDKSTQDEIRKMDIYTAMQSSLDYTGIPVVFRWLETENAGSKRKVNFEVVLPASGVTIDRGASNLVNIEFAAMARNPKGDRAGDFAQNFQAKLSPAAVAQVEESGITYSKAIELAPGQYKVRFVVRDNVSGRLGSVEAPITVQ